MAAAVDDSNIEVTRSKPIDPEKGSNPEGNIEHVPDASQDVQPEVHGIGGSGINLQTALAFIVWALL